MKRLSITQARALIKRELGISAAALEKPPEMNGNPQYPWYSMESGKLSVEVYTNEHLDGKMIALHLGFSDGLGDISRYFYADTLEEAPEYTEVRRWEDIYDLVEGKSEEQLADTVNRLSNTARKAYWKHAGMHLG